MTDIQVIHLQCCMESQKIEDNLSVQAQGRLISRRPSIQWNITQLSKWTEEVGGTKVAEEKPLKIHPSGKATGKTGKHGQNQVFQNSGN